VNDWRAEVAQNQTPQSKLDRVLAEQREYIARREQGYRERALKMYPWICGRCAREFTRANLRELTVHHINHDHDYNPPDGSNWELLCIYCHDEEHKSFQISYATAVRANANKRQRHTSPSPT